MQDKSGERLTERVKWKEKPRRQDSERVQRKFLEHREESVFIKGAVKGKVEESKKKEKRKGKRLNEDREMLEECLAQTWIPKTCHWRLPPSGGPGKHTKKQRYQKSLEKARPDSCSLSDELNFTMAKKFSC